MRALRELFRQGVQNREGQQLTGLQDLIDQLKNRRRQQLQQYNMDSVIDDLQERLNDVIQTEREGIGRRMEQARQQLSEASDQERSQQESFYNMLEERAKRNQEKLDNLPEGIGGQIKELMEYDFIDQEAQRKFQELLDMLKNQMAQNISQQMVQQAQSMSPESMAAMREMMRQLNQMDAGQDGGARARFRRVHATVRVHVRPQPSAKLRRVDGAAATATVPDAVHVGEHVAGDAARIGRTLSTRPSTRRPRMEMAEFASLMEQLMPMDDLRRQYPFLGDDSLTMEQAMELMRGLQEQDQMEEAMRQAMRTGNLEDVDPDKLAELLGEGGAPGVGTVGPAAQASTRGRLRYRR